MKALKDYLRALNHGKELERLTIINWLEEVDQIDAFGDTCLLYTSDAADE